MDRRGVPRHRNGVAPHRWIAICGAIAVTTVAIAGSLGVVPGVAVREPSAGHHGHQAGDLDASGEESGHGSGEGDTVAGQATLGADAEAESQSSSEPPTSGGSASDQPEEALGVTSPPDESSADELAVPASSGHGERVVYDVSAQRVWLLRDDGSTARTYLVSGGRDPSTLPPGTYHVYSKSRHAIAYNYQETMEFMVRFAYGAHAPIGFHDIPVGLDDVRVQTRAQLGSPLSAGCIRQARPDAVSLWRFTDVGTAVVVVP